MTINALPHQSAVVSLIQAKLNQPYFFLIGGFGCGKSFTDVIFLLYLVSEYRYCKEPVKFGIFGVTIKLLKQTVIADFCRFLEMLGVSFKNNSQEGTITVGNITFVYLQMQNPGDIYAHNFHGALVDELDEVVAEKVLPIVEAIQERCRKTLPAGRSMPSRSAFMLFTTTAQGLGGTYQFVEKLRKQNRKAREQGLPAPVPFSIIHAHTEDNPHNDPEQIKRLRALYTEEEAAAYLDGKFMNLAVGRVWYSFDRRINMCMRFPVATDDIVYVGQDFNLGINASCELIVRGDIVYIVASHHWKDMGEAAELLPRFYPGNRIIFIPDASGKEIMQGFAAEFDRAGIEIFWNNRNPSINERVMAGNLLFRRKQCYIMEPGEGKAKGEDLIGLTSKQSRLGDVDNALLCLETHDIDEKTGKPRKGAGINAPDHFSDSFSYGIWRIIHSIKGYDDILEALKGVHHRVYEAA